MKATGYSLWLMPEEDTTSYRFLKAQIAKLAKIADSPVFPPHVTVLGGIQGNMTQILSKGELITQYTAPFEVQLGALASEHQYFKAYFAEVTPSTELLDMNKRTAVIFRKEEEPFLPHLSLSYFDHSESVLAKLQDAMAGVDMSEGNFTARSIKLLRTEGGVKEWRHVFDYRFFR